MKEAQSKQFPAMGKICLVLALVMAVCVAMLAASPDTALAKSSTNKKAVAAYSKMLSKKKIPWSEVPNAVSSSKIKFACKDINKDGVKDLVVYRTDGCEATGWYEIYTYVKGKVKSLGHYDYIDIYPNKNCFVHHNSGHGFGSERYYRITKSGTLKKLASYEFNIGPKAPKGVGKTVKKTVDGMPRYLYDFQINGKKTTYSKCIKQINSLKKAAKDNLKYVKNTKANRKKYLS